MFFCEYCEIFRSSFFTEHLPRWQLLNTEQKNPARKIYTSTTQYPIDHHAIIKLIKNRDWKYVSLVLVFPSIKYSKFQLLNKYQKEIYQVCFPGTFLNIFGDLFGRTPWTFLTSDWLTKYVKADYTSRIEKHRNSLSNTSQNCQKWTAFVISKYFLINIHCVRCHFNVYMPKS